MIQRLVGGSIALAVSATLASLAHAQTSPQTSVNVDVRYWKRPCGMPAALAESARVTAGTLRVQDGTGRTTSIALGAAPAPLTLSVADPWTATLLLETPRIRMVGATAEATAIDLAPAVVQNGTATFSMYLKEDDRNANINALLELERAALYAAQANGAPLPRVSAHLLDAASAAAAGVSHFDAPQRINVIPDDRWDATPLIHEYGHHVLHEVAPGGPAGDEHYTEKSYPEKPDLAWTEGFPDGFTGLVTQPESAGIVLRRCGPYMSFAEKPARPRLAPADARYAQYNETRVAAAMYDLVDYLGGGTAGFGRLLTAMRAYRRDGHGVWTARDLRDLAVQHFERNAFDHAAIDGIFLLQGMSWTQHFVFGIPEMPSTYLRAAEDEIVVSVTGPNGFECRSADDTDAAHIETLDGGVGIVVGERVAEGGIAYSANDDCYLVTGDGKVAEAEPHGLGSDSVDIPFPYLDRLAHWTGPFTVHAKYVCEFNQALGTRRQFRCPSTFTVLLSVNNLLLPLNVPAFREPIPVTLVKDVEMAIVTFEANGNCKLIGGVDCGF